MGKFLHDDAGLDCGHTAERLGIRWPGLPWRCPKCDVMFTSHESTVATLDIGRYSHPEETRFLCMLCDLASHVFPEPP